MKILFYSWNGFNEDIVKLHLKEMGHELIELTGECKDFVLDTELMTKMLFMINKEKADCVFSFNYYPFISLVCNTCKIPYYSWVFDSPHLQLYAKTSLFDCNRIGVFDRQFAGFLTSMGIPNVKHIPLSADTDIMDTRILKDCPKYRSDISFVGSMYTDAIKCNLYDIFRKEALKEEKEVAAWNEADSFIESHTFAPSKSLLSEDLSAINTLIAPYMKTHNMGLDDKFLSVDDIILREAIIEKKITVSERQTLMKALALYSEETRHSFSLYTDSDVSELTELSKVKKGPADYVREMPSVFYHSKININLTLKSIHTGIPLRALDILACKGFLLSNPQDELLESFTPGVHFDTFITPDECVEKADYYLKHDDIRGRIAEKGYARVKEIFTYKKALDKLFSI